MTITNAIHKIKEKIEEKKSAKAKKAAEVKPVDISVEDDDKTESGLLTEE